MADDEKLDEQKIRAACEAQAISINRIGDTGRRTREVLRHGWNTGNALSLNTVGP